jgi:predicted secreted protein
MNIVTGIIVYMVIWWTIFFAALPFGVRVPEKQELGHSSGAPDKPMIGKKALYTTLVTTVLWVMYYMAIDAGWNIDSF